MGKGGCRRFAQPAYRFSTQRANDRRIASAMMKPTVLILRHMPHEPGGTLETALTDAGLDFHYFDLYKEIPDRLPLDRAVGAGRARRSDERRRGRPLSVSGPRRAMDRAGPGDGIAAAGHLPRLATAGQNPRGTGLSEPRQGDRLVSGRTDARGGRRSAVRPERPADGVPMARRHVRSAGRGHPPGPRPCVREPGVSLRAEMPTGCNFTSK